MVSFENFVKSMPPSLSELKVIPIFCFAFKIPDDVTATNTQRKLLYFVNRQSGKKGQNLTFKVNFPCKNLSDFFFRLKI
jgi:hypothetical protein